MGLGIVIVTLGTLACFARLQVRPLLLTGPAAALLAIFAVPIAATAISGGHPPPWWLVRATVATTTALVAAAIAVVDQVRDARG